MSKEKVRNFSTRVPIDGEGEKRLCFDTYPTHMSARAPRDEGAREREKEAKEDVAHV